VPRIRLADARVQALRHAVDLVHRDHSPRRHALGDEDRVGPLVVLRKTVNPVAWVKNVGSEIGFNAAGG